MKSIKSATCISLLLFLSILTACAKAAPVSTPTTAITEPPAEATSAPPVETIAPTEALTVEATSSPETADADVLPPEPRIVTITTADSYTLSGYYYPAATNPAPLVILMHWMGGDMADWYELAVWLQNRGQVNPFTNPADMPWWDPTWFPSMPADRSYGVLIFSFRGCKPYQTGCQNVDRSGWLQDAQSAIQFGHELDGVDTNRIVAIGSSIGADGAADGCEMVNEKTPGACQGSLSLSPGDYLGVSYKTIINKMGNLEKPATAWCLADNYESYVCEEAGKEANPDYYRAIEIPGGGHGNNLLSPNLDPLPMQLILDFLDETVP